MDAMAANSYGACSHVPTTPRVHLGVSRSVARTCEQTPDTSREAFLSYGRETMPCHQNENQSNSFRHFGEEEQAEK